MFLSVNGLGGSYPIYGEEGLEIILPASQAVSLLASADQAWRQALWFWERDTLRLEAGMNLYGSDMDESISPLQKWHGVGPSPGNQRHVGSSAEMP